MAPFDGRLRRPVLAACFCGRCRTCMGRTAADHRRILPMRRTSAPRRGVRRRSVRLSWRTAALEIRRTLDDRFQLARETFASIFRALVSAHRAAAVEPRGCRLLVSFSR